MAIRRQEEPGAVKFLLDGGVNSFASDSNTKTQRIARFALHANEFYISASSKREKPGNESIVAFIYAMKGENREICFVWRMQLNYKREE